MLGSGKSFDFQRKYHTAVMVYKSINDLAIEYLSNLFTNRASVTSNSLRDTESKLAVLQPHTNYLKIALAREECGAVE